MRTSILVHVTETLKTYSMWVFNDIMYLLDGLTESRSESTVGPWISHFFGLTLLLLTELTRHVSVKTANGMVNAVQRVQLGWHRFNVFSNLSRQSHG